MNNSDSKGSERNAGLAKGITALCALLAAAVVICWLARSPKVPLEMRNPGSDHAQGAESGSSSNPVLSGEVVKGEGIPSKVKGAWMGFRGNARDGTFRPLTELPAPSGQAPGATPTVELARSWEGSSPRELWGTDVGEGYAGPSVADGRVYLMDYDREKKRDTLRCLSLDNGKEIWRYSYPVTVKRNHGMSRTVPAIQGAFVVGMGPKCHVICLDAITGERRWGLDLVRQFGTTVPQWYAGQCPLIDNGVVILAPGGKDALILAVELTTGRILWKTPNPKGWKMTHSSIMPMDFGGHRSYVYCASQGVAGVAAKDGALLWDTTDWKISIATVPSPVVVPEGRIFLSGGYNAGSLMLQLTQEGDRFTAKTLFRLAPETFGATQQTPVFKDGHLYGVRADGQFVCLDLQGKIVWTSGAEHVFGLGSFLLTENDPFSSEKGPDLIYALNDSGRLSLMEATSARFNLLGQAQALTKGRESWGPMALAGGRLLVRDLTRLVCLDVGQR